MKTKMKKFYRRLFSEVKKELLEAIKDNFANGEIGFDDLDKPMTSKEICNHYNISSSTLERYIRQGLVIQRKKKNCKRFFTKSEFNKFINTNKKRK